MINTYQKSLSGQTVGVVFGTFAPLHQGHLDVIMRAKRENDGGCIVIVDGHDNDRGGKEMPLKKRYRYVREYFADDDLVAVYGIDETERGIPAYPHGWESFMEAVHSILTMGATAENFVFYVGEAEYAESLTTVYGHQAVLLDRTENPISATMIRANPIKYWEKIAFPFRRIFSTNILILGTASEGKTTLTKDLGKYFNAPYSEEYARQYMTESGVSEWELDGTDYMAFLNGQYQRNKKLINSPANQGIFFADSDSITTRTYAEYYCQDPQLDLTEEEAANVAITADVITAKCKWDKIYLICPRGAFVDDHTRYMAFSGMDERKEIFDIMCRNLHNAGLWDKVTILDGGYYSNFIKIKKDVEEIKNG